ncbi:MAG TPA: FHA domain-containing protein [Candidatus Nitrosotenuis sp.]|nr:FHA domain-containing protein [Candidatus Nitrosotenuis sp.]
MHLFCRIQAARDGSSYQVQLRDLAAGSFDLTLTQPVLACERRRLQDALQAFLKAVRGSPWGGPPEPPALEELSEAIASVLPGEVHRRLQQPALQGAALSLLTDEDLVPWELVRLEAGTLLWQKLLVGRRRSDPTANTVEGRAPERGRPRVLVVADPDGLLPWTREEARRVREALAEDHEVEILQGPQATGQALLGRLAQDPYVLVHLAASLEQGQSGSRLYLADGPLEPRALAGAAMPQAPGIVFLQAYPVGRLGADLPLQAPLAAWVDVLLERGVEAVAAPCWQPCEQAALDLAPDCYRRLARGAPLGLALQKARLELARAWPADATASAHAYLLWGEPSVRLADLRGRQRPEPATVASLLQSLYTLLFLEGPEEGREVPLFPHSLPEGRAILIGGPGLRVNDIEIDDPSVDNQAASLERQGDRLYLNNQTGVAARVRVNDLPVAARVALGGGETVRMGATAFRVEPALPGPPRRPLPSAEEGRFYLEVVEGTEADRGRRFPLRGTSVQVGRLPECTIRLHDPAVSRHHLSLLQQEGEWVLHHRGSNPTVVNGVAVDAERPLRHGDLIQLSEASVLFFGDSHKGTPGSAR